MQRRSRPVLAIVLLLLLGTAATLAQSGSAIPAGTSVQVRITEKLSSESANVGQQFHGVGMAGLRRRRQQSRLLHFAAAETTPSGEVHRNRATAWLSIRCAS